MEAVDRFARRESGGVFQAAYGLESGGIELYALRACSDIELSLSAFGQGGECVWGGNGCGEGVGCRHITVDVPGGEQYDFSRCGGVQAEGLVFKRIMVELPCPVVQPVQPGSGENPKVIPAAGNDFPDLVVAKAIAVEVVVPVDGKFITVEAVEPVVSAEPKESGAVLTDGCDAILG